ncbi:type I pullulanase [Massilimicrobiota sp. An142]|uniref:type I pullulanase n=1 Tax=unclassified Massilimicrobiota TaxID=2619866 RepID=UPI000B386C45|nr:MULTISPECIES: type I pullulanase [unclassified Massilimicrobiota]OUQ12948.1 type I pullulanase [Massilimicrobiota sp. An142]OUQ80295.1 type I pullulanase [Massilimicrobiota sp. An105]
MEESAVRMKAYAVAFDEIRVYLSKGYYNGISSQFYIKNIENDELIPLNGDSLNNSSQDGFQEYVFHTNFTMGKVYKVVDAYGLSCYLDFSKLSMCEEFDELYFYDHNDLGNQYTKEKTTFKVWAPLATGVILKVMKWNGETELFPMKRQKKGIYFVEVCEDLELEQYVYLIRHTNSYEVTLDPYAYSSSSNGRASIIVDLEKVPCRQFDLPVLEKMTDMVIYETSVRDFSMSSTSGMKNKGKFLAFTELNTSTDSGNPTGLDYLSCLGITHLQLMPIADFATVDEKNPLELYNWGYDPLAYNVTEGSYVTDPDDGYMRITEAQRMVEALHSRGIRVVMDVVFNHMHDVNINALERTVPYYFFRRNGDGSLSNGSWCGNDLNTTALMCRKYILDMCRRWQVLYGIDGFRFDLMGIIDQETMKLVDAQGKALDPSFVVYGEGWNMPTALDEEMRTTIQNNLKTPYIGFFNDFFRDTLRGTNQMETKGYFSGDTYKTNDAMKAICNLDMFAKITQSINYVECHDNATCYDKLQISNYDESEKIRKRRSRLMMAAVILSQGVPFLHSGQEFFRTKGGLSNTYNAGDQVNALDWNRKDMEIDTTQFVQFLIHLRKNNPCFRYGSYDMIRKNVKTENINHRMIKYSLHQNEGEYKDFIIYFNASLETLQVEVEDGFQLLYHSEKGKILDHQLDVNGVCLAILVR